MALQYYLAPWQTVITPHSATGQGSRVLTYAIPRTSTIKANGVKTFCLTGIDTDAAIHAAIAVDPSIFALPFDPADLERRWDALSLDARSKIGTALDDRRIPTDWIANTTTPREVLKQIIRALLACQRLGAFYPEAPLDTRWNQLPRAMRDAITADLLKGGVPTADVTATTPVRDIVRKFALYAEVVKWLAVDASISDDFNRADSTSLGANWTEDSGDWAITSNTLRQTSSGNVYRKCRHNTALDSANYDVEVDGRSGGSAIGVGPFGRGAASAAVTYYGFISFEGDANYIVEITAGSEAILATGTAPPAASTNFRLRCDGSTLTGFENDISDATVVDATLTSGAVGVASYANPNGAGAFADNFAAADLAGGPVTYNETGGAISTGQSSGVDLNVFNETGASRSPISGRGIDSNVFGETGSASSPARASGVDANVFNETGGASSTISADSSDSVVYNETGAAQAPAVASGVDANIFDEAGAGSVPAVASGADSNVFGETGGAQSPAVASGTSSSNQVYDKAGGAQAPGVATSTDSVVYDETGQSQTPAIASGDDANLFYETGSASAAAQATSADQAIYNETGGASAPGVSSGERAGIQTFTKTGGAQSPVSVAGVDSVVYTETGTAEAPAVASGVSQTGALGGGSATWIPYGIIPGLDYTIEQPQESPDYKRRRILKDDEEIAEILALLM